jgi:hypothetical protein
VTLGAISLLPVALYWKILMLLFLKRVGIRAWQVHVTRTHKHAVTKLWQNAKGEWGCILKNKHRVTTKVAGDSFKSPWLIILRLRTMSRTISVVIPVDMLSNIQYRTLHTRLNFFTNIHRSIKK